MHIALLARYPEDAEVRRAVGQRGAMILCLLRFQFRRKPHTDEYAGAAMVDSSARCASRKALNAWMLLGKLVAGEGKLYTPTHAARGGRRYFYYTLKANSGSLKGAVIRRLPACEVERNVIQSVRSFLQDSRRVAEHFLGEDLRKTKSLTSAAHECARILDEGSESEKTRIIRRLVCRVTVLPKELHLLLDRTGLAAELLSEGTRLVGRPVTITLEAAFEVAWCGNEVRLILADGNQAGKPVKALVHAVHEARTWAGWIAQGKVTTLRELAERAGHSRQHTSRVLRLAALSPTLSDSIRRGEHAPELTLRATDPTDTAGLGASEATWLTVQHTAPARAGRRTR